MIVDESLVSMADAKALLAAQACDVFNIKISKCGGLLRSRAIAQLASETGIDCQVGTHVGETHILGAAGLKLAGSIPNFDCYGGGSEVLFSNLTEEKLTAAGPVTAPGTKDVRIERLLSHSTMLLDRRRGTQG